MIQYLCYLETDNVASTIPVLKLPRWTATASQSSLMNSMENSYRAVALVYQFSFGRMAQTDQCQIFIEFILSKEVFPLPFIVEKEEA